MEGTIAPRLSKDASQDDMNMANLTRLASIAFALSLFAVTGAAQQASGPRLGGPDAVENQVASDFGETWDDPKRTLRPSELGLWLGHASSPHQHECFPIAM